MRYLLEFRIPPYPVDVLKESKTSEVERVYPWPRTFTQIPHHIILLSSFSLHLFSFPSPFCVVSFFLSFLLSFLSPFLTVSASIPYQDSSSFFLFVSLIHFLPFNIYVLTQEFLLIIIVLLLSGSCTSYHPMCSYCWCGDTKCQEDRVFSAVCPWYWTYQSSSDTSFCWHWE